MAEKTVTLPEAIVEDGQHVWLSRLANVIVIPGDALLLIDDPVCGEYAAERVREFALALLAAADAAEGKS